jgi:geranylgeranyl diphosphate synthase type II
MLINAVNRADNRQRAELERWIAARDFDRQEKVAAVTRLYDEIGIRQLCEEKINYYFELARHTLDEVCVPEERKQPLRQYMEELLHRDK